MNRHIAELADIWERDYPDLWRKCYPRVYQGAGEYESPRYIALLLASSIKWVETDSRLAPISSKHVALAASRAFDYGLPAFFITREFLAAISNTDLPDDLKWTDVRLPFEAGLIYLPTTALKDPEGAGVNVLGWLRQRKGDSVMVGERVQISGMDDTFTVFGVCDTRTERLYSRSVSAASAPYIVAPTIASGAQGVFDLPITKDDEAFLSQMVCLCFSILLSVSVRPEMLTEGRRVTGKRAKRRQRETWTPNYIGRNYVARRESQGGTHASPRLHWRRGHFRHQRYGAHLSESKLIWIEPTIVSAKENE